MSGDSNYCYKGSKDFVIENGIIKGVESPFVTQYTSYGELVLDNLKANPDFCGQVDGLTGKENTFAEMMEKSVKCAMWMKKNGIKPGDIIGVCTHNHTDMYIPCFASLFTGAVLNPWWDTGLTKDVAKYFINLTKPKIVFVNEASANMVLEVAKKVGVELKLVVFGKHPGLESLDDILASQDSKLVSEFRCTKLSSLDDPAIILYTSGTTGLPKGALYSHKCCFGNLKSAANLSQKSDHMTTMIFSPLSWVSGTLLMLRGVAILEKRIIYPEFQEEKCLELIEKYKVNWMLMAPSTAFRTQKSPALSKYDLSEFKYLAIGGTVLKEKAQKSLTESFPHTTIVQAYGCTEMGGVAAQQSKDSKPGSCGTIAQNVIMKVIDPQSGRILGPNETGEGCFKSPYLMTCYYNNPEQTRKTIDSEGWLHTGDLIHYDEEGNIFVTDRIKEIIKFRGHHVPPAMVEQLLQTHPGITEVAVLSIPHDTDDEHPIAFVCKTPESEVTKEDLEKMVAETLPDYMKLRGGVQFLDELPHTPSGKVARTNLRTLARSYAR